MDDPFIFQFPVFVVVEENPPGHPEPLGMPAVVQFSGVDKAVVLFTDDDLAA